jgi:hypothetical protein
MFHCRKAETGRISAPFSGNEQLPEGPSISGDLIPPQSAQQRRPGRPVREIPGSARYEHDKNERIRAAIPHQGARNLSCRCLVLFTPRNKKSKQNRRETTRIRRNSHGIARAIENLRGVRLSLVPCPDQGSVYCKECEVKLKDFPSPESRKRRGRQAASRWSKVWAVAEAMGGAQ